MLSARRVEALEEFRATFSTGVPPGLEAVRSRINGAGVRITHLRGVYWRLFLSSPPLPVTEEGMSEWPAVLASSRAAFAELKARHSIDPNQTELDPTINNPLSEVDDSPWQEYFRATEIEKEIAKDVERIYPELEFFESPRVRETLCQVLYVWSREHPEPGYRQGMHELLAPFVYVLEREQLTRPCDGEQDSTEPWPPVDDPNALVLAQLASGDHVAADAYTLFTKMMETCAPWFEVDRRRFSRRMMASERSIVKEELAAASSGKSLPMDAQKMAPAMPSPQKTKLPVLAKCELIQQVLLPKHDSELAKHLDSFDVEPQLYALRWIRLLFGREFHLEDVLLVWDGLFSDPDGMESLLEFICVAMLVFIRQQLLGMTDYSLLLRRLMRYPPVEDVTVLVEKARHLRSPPPAPPALIRIPPPSTTPERRPAPRKPGIRLPSRSPATNNQRVLASRAADHLKLICEVMEKELLGETAPDPGRVLIALADLKRVRDVLSGDLPLDALANKPFSLMDSKKAADEDDDLFATPTPSKPQKAPEAPTPPTTEHAVVDPLGGRNPILAAVKTPPMRGRRKGPTTNSDLSNLL